ncbi:MAG: conjugal transfer protein TrbD [Desulfobulbaceae bacterium]|jgi:type IV secretory pathway TrbD component|nr:conjugal transfer protein TrbD [Desulfobulbaceae bacterium]NQS71226.1 conjugal transfer protein TrbD [Desulfobulbaceae bacterium]
MDEPRSIPIRQSLHRPELVMGGEREPVMCAALMAIITGIVGAVQAAFVTVFIALAFYFGVVFVFRRMAKADPDMTRVWRRHMGYKNFYRARSPFWAREGYRK